MSCPSQPGAELQAVPASGCQVPACHPLPVHDCPLDTSLLGRLFWDLNLLTFEGTTRLGCSCGSAGL